MTVPSVPDSDLATRLRREPVVLDGGLATQLEATGHDLGSDLWSARLLTEDPAAITAAHAAFYAAGAEVAITASYQASFEGFAAAGIDAAGTEALLRRSCELAGRARDQQPDDRPRWVAASVGPYGAALADGSEYRGDYGLSVDQLRAWHRPRLQVLLQAVTDGLADVLAIETIPSTAEAEAILAEVDGSGVIAWLSLTAEAGRTRTGEPLEEVFAAAADVAEVVAVGVNCCAAADVAGALAAAGSAGLPGVAYPNSGERWDAAGRRWHGDPTFAAAMVSDWVDAGAALVGGCCRVLPGQIAGIAAACRR